MNCVSVFDFIEISLGEKVTKGWLNLIEQLIKSATNRCQWKNKERSFEYLIWFKMSANKVGIK